ncbi:MAG: hypothetical protein JO270_25295 [Acidobacteriaceae bacterium]|nr:hypothetical protein [Acidobacteriaceae bacterium]MBV8569259.1 hypothetical protein [Acidobacteriaceae bacterium]
MHARIALKVVSALLVAGAFYVATIPGISKDKYETIEATAMGTGTQLGQNIGVTLNIYEFSTPQDRAMLVQAFEKGQNQGLVNALQRMKAVGHVEITGTLGYDCSFIKMIPTPTGRQIRFVTNRLLRFGEVFWDTQSTAYNLTAGEFDLNDTDRAKSTGKLYPAAQLAIDKQGQLQFELRENPWNLVDVLDWKGTPGVN